MWIQEATWSYLLGLTWMSWNKAALHSSIIVYTYPLGTLKKKKSLFHCHIEQGHLRLWQSAGFTPPHSDVFMNLKSAEMLTAPQKKMSQVINFPHSSKTQ